MNQIILGGGCFWCTEAVFSRLKGISNVTPGYAGGEGENPTYSTIHNSDDKHAEVIKIEYDPEVITIRKILQVFFTTHDPTTLNQQGADRGAEYRSIILHTKEEERRKIEEFIKEIQREFDRPIVTEVSKAGKFWSAEKEHNKYYEKNKSNTYCTLVIDPKIKKLKEKFSKELREDS